MDEFKINYYVVGEVTNTGADDSTLTDTIATSGSLHLSTNSMAILFRIFSFWFIFIGKLSTFGFCNSKIHFEFYSMF